VKAFADQFGAMRPNAVEKITDKVDDLLAFVLTDGRTSAVVVELLSDQTTAPRRGTSPRYCLSSSATQPGSRHLSWRASDPLPRHSLARGDRCLPRSLVRAAATFERGLLAERAERAA